jgi:FKBP-type peptidyl-prolyl cis-trans isomerase 2
VVGAANDFIKAIQDVLVGKEIGYSDTITVKPEQGYGYLYDTRNIQQLPLKMFTIAGMNPQIGATQDLGGVKGIVKSID